MALKKRTPSLEGVLPNNKNAPSMSCRPSPDESDSTDIEDDPSSSILKQSSPLPNEPDGCLPIEGANHEEVVIKQEPMALKKKTPSPEGVLSNNKNAPSMSCRPCQDDSNSTDIEDDQSSSILKQSAPLPNEPDACSPVEDANHKETAIKQQPVSDSEESDMITIYIMSVPEIKDEPLDNHFTSLDFEIYKSTTQPSETVARSPFEGAGHNEMVIKQKPVCDSELFDSQEEEEIQIKQEPESEPEEDDSMACFDEPDHKSLTSELLSEPATHLGLPEGVIIKEEPPDSPQSPAEVLIKEEPMSEEEECYDNYNNDFIYNPNATYNPDGTWGENIPEYMYPPQEEELPQEGDGVGQFPGGGLYEQNPEEDIYAAGPSGLQQTQCKGQSQNVDIYAPGPSGLQQRLDDNSEEDAANRASSNNEPDSKPPPFFAFKRIKLVALTKLVEKDEEKKVEQKKETDQKDDEGKEA